MEESYGMAKMSDLHSLIRNFLLSLSQRWAKLGQQPSYNLGEQKKKVSYCHFINILMHQSGLMVSNRCDCNITEHFVLISW